MSDSQSLRIAVAFARETARSPMARLCTACLEVLDVTGAGITVLSGAQPGPVCVSDSNVADLEVLQFRSGRGPCRDAFSSGESMHWPRLDAVAAQRWRPFVDVAQAHGIRSVSAFPLISPTASVGVLTLYHAHEGDLSAVQHDDSIAVARVLADTLSSLMTTEVGGLRLDEPVPYRAEIHQASGMAAVQLGTTPSEALVLIRVHAFANDMTVYDVAIEIIERRLRLRDDHPDAQR